MLEAALLPCFATGIPAADTMIEAKVDILIELEPSPPVPTISRTSISFKNFSQCALKTLAAAVISSIVSPFAARAVRNAAFCASVASPDIISSITSFICTAVKSSFLTSFAIASLIILP